jgi:SsrA-binding protein
MNNSIKLVAKNKKAYHDYFIEQKLEVGIELVGTEVKSIRQGKVNLKDSWCSIVKGEMMLNGVHISAYEKGNIFNRDPVRVRKLLLHKKEIEKLGLLIKQQSYTVIPLSIYFKGSLVKLEIGVCKGKKLYDKRDVMAKESAKRDMQRALKEAQR